jgi:VIT1/CCC1 family predicted Fe2+/Mn2+ transporter
MVTEPAAVDVHPERHMGGSHTIRDLILGIADGLTVPFALAAGVSGAVAGSGLVVTAGLAEIVAGAISMGLGGYLAARTEAQHYTREYAREVRETQQIPDEERAEVAEILARYGVREPVLTTVVDEIARDQHAWVDFMMRNELGLERPDINAAPRSAVLVGGGYALEALLWSCAFTSVALIGFGALRARYLRTPIVLGSVTTWFIGALAAGAAYGLARLVSHGMS